MNEFFEITNLENKLLKNIKRKAEELILCETKLKSKKNGVENYIKNNLSLPVFYKFKSEILGGIGKLSWMEGCKEKLDFNIDMNETGLPDIPSLLQKISTGFENLCEDLSTHHSLTQFSEQKNRDKYEKLHKREHYLGIKQHKLEQDSSLLEAEKLQYSKRVQLHQEKTHLKLKVKEFDALYKQLVQEKVNFEEYEKGKRVDLGRQEEKLKQDIRKLQVLEGDFKHRKCKSTDKSQNIRALDDIKHQIRKKEEQKAKLEGQLKDLLLEIYRKKKEYRTLDLKKKNNKSRKSSDFGGWEKSWK